ncbi:MAG: hypothetical protein AB1589_35395 [Cyanobacteriota bacterium]
MLRRDLPALIWKGGLSMRIWYDYLKTNPNLEDSDRQLCDRTQAN